VSRLADVFWGTPEGGEFVARAAERAATYTVSAFVDGVLLGVLPIAVMIVLRRAVLRVNQTKLRCRDVAAVRRRPVAEADRTVPALHG
jgi:hypothetical protein